MDEFLSTESDCSIVFECFTSPKDESDALEMIRTIDPLVSSKTILKSVAKSVLPKGVIEVAKRVLK
jgi:2-succinyl-5-enolpyruvyl-6-hydroxy-3-cyclohexene-1-carboxylate synthase